MKTVDVGEHVGLCKSLARRRFTGSDPAVDVEDRQQEAALAMVKAARRFDPRRGAKFATYAHYSIVGAIKTQRQRSDRQRRDTVPIHSLPAEQHPSYSFSDKQFEQRELLGVLMTVLSRRARLVVRHRASGETFDQIGQRLRISDESARLIYVRSIATLRAKAELMGERAA